MNLPPIDVWLTVLLKNDRWTIAAKDLMETDKPWGDLRDYRYSDDDIAEWWYLPKTGTGNKIKEES